MRFPGLVLVAMVMALSLAGCMQMEKIVKVSADGSGTIEETVIRNKEMADTFAQISAQSKGVRTEFYDEARFKAAAARMGEGVTFLSAKQFKTDKGEGFTVVYAFTDINKVKLDPNPNDLAEGAGGTVASKPEQFVTFRFAKGTSAELHVLMPSADAKPEASPIDFSKLDSQLVQTFREGLKDMRSTLAVEVAGNIRETNAEYHQGSRVTLDDMDYSKVTADKQRFEALLKANPASRRTEKTMLSGVEGVKIEIQPDVKIEFQ